jgi:NAD(P)H-nitrite reductase large subunit
MDLEGVVTLDTLNDARRILKLSTRARRAVVIGGGITALELAEGLTARGVSTHYLMRKDHFYRKVLEQIESEMVEQALVERGIKLHRRAQIREVRGRRGKVSGVITDQGDTIKCQLLAVAVGIRPNLELAHAANLQVDRGILVDEAMQTSVGDIFAAGDAAQVFDPLTGDWKMDSLWWMAQEQGRVAGENMVGGGRTFTRSTPFNVTCLGGIVTTIIGTVGQGKEDPDLITIVHGDSESWRDQLDSFVVVSGDKRDHVRIVLDREKVIGAVVMGDQTLSRPLQDIIQRQVRLGRFRHLLMREPRKALELLVKSYGKRRADLWTEAA